MKNKELEKIAKAVAHPFISLIPNQKDLDKKINWYNPVIGILESSSLEIVLPLLYVSMNPSLAGLTIGGALMLDGMERINNLIDEVNSSKKGTIFLEAPYNLYKKIKGK